MIVQRFAHLLNRRYRIYRAARYLPNHSTAPLHEVSVLNTSRQFADSRVEIVEDGFADSEIDQFRQDAEYEFYYPNYYVDRPMVKLKKIREHYVAAKLLKLNSNDIFLDIASQYSPAPLVYERIYKCRVLRQDLEYETGINSRVIGGSAGNMPLESGSITKMALHCSLEHFEGDEDINLIREAERVLAIGGQLAIVPLYLCDTYFIITKPSVWAKEDQSQWPVFPSDALIYTPDSAGNRFERYYDFNHFKDRILNNTGLNFKLHSFGNQDSCTTGQLRFAGVFAKI